ncbi:beta/gamma crystallin-related protein [Janthinobacterium sp. Mn2066]|uniref:beta/gamma crystallin-related protein n=1 Tax=Janthinobacterium sp. Mn2066 TaxID=3395264 RepID=UPI003BD16A4D
MNRTLKHALVCAAILLSHAAAQAGEISLYTDVNFRGRVVVLRDASDDLSRINFNDTASSIRVGSGSWEVCTDSEFRGQCRTLGPGDYSSLDGMNDKISSVREAGRDGGGSGPRPALELFSDRNQRGASAPVNADRDDFMAISFNDRANSIRVERGYWQLCSDSNYRGSCQVFGPGSYDDLGRDLNGRVSSARLVDPREANRPRGGDNLVVLYARSDMRGPGLSVNRDVRDLVSMNYNDQASSIVVHEGTWEMCEDSQYNGKCEVMGPGNYPDLKGLDKSISSLRRLD